MSRASIPALAFLLWLTGPAALFAQPDREEIRYSSGNIQVKRRIDTDQKGNEYPYHYLLRDSIYYGSCFTGEKVRRIPTTYYYAESPIGMVFQQFNWFPGPIATYAADARLPASLVALGGDPLTQLTSLWTEPPVAVIGMEAGTPASYARLAQHFDFYEPNKDLIKLHQRESKDRFFHYLPNAIDRGAVVRIVEGSPRDQLAKQAPRGFYRLMILEACSGEDSEKIFLDLLTKEGIAQCMEHLAEDGVLCVHTSHRFLDLATVLAEITQKLKLHARCGKDETPGQLRRELAEIGNFSSEWVMIAKRPATLNFYCRTPKGYLERMKKERLWDAKEYWKTPQSVGHLWTDAGPNLLHGVLRGHPFSMRYAGWMSPVAETLGDIMLRIGVPKYSGPHRFVLELPRLPRSVEQWMIESQLSYNPQVEKLWRTGSR